MSKVLVTESNLSGIAAAIRTKNGTQNTYKPGQMADAIQNIPNTYAAGDEGKVVSNGALVAQTSKSISANGTVDTTTNDEVVVAVPNTYAAGDEGKVVSNGALVAQTARSSEINANGTYDTTLNNRVTVNISGGGTDPSLPSEYQEVEYLQTNGNQWVSINCSIGSNDFVCCKLSKPTNTTGEAGFWGVDGKYELYWQNGTMTNYFYYSSVFNKAIGSDDGIIICQITGNSNSSFLFGRYRSDKYPYAGKLYYMYIDHFAFNSDLDVVITRKTKLVPCYRKSDNVAGFYDVMNSVFYTNVGSGSFVVGGDVT